jgi:hypothetical protein
MNTSSRALRLFVSVGLAGAGAAQGPVWASITAWPGASQDHAMAYDEGRARTLLFGGRDGATLFGDTWEWDGEAWARFTPASSPSPRWGHAMAYDLGRGVTVLFGGCDAAGPLGDTWEWDGRGWRQIVTANAPSPRQHVMAGWVLYPSLDSHVVLFSGFRSNSNSYIQDTWTFDGTNWTQHAAPGPLARKNAAMARSSTYGLAVLMI